MRKRCIRCGERKVLAEFVDPVLNRRSMKRGRAALSHVCGRCRSDRSARRKARREERR